MRLITRPVEPKMTTLNERPSYTLTYLSKNNNMPILLHVDVSKHINDICLKYGSFLV